MRVRPLHACDLADQPRGLGAVEFRGERVVRVRRDRREKRRDDESRGCEFSFHANSFVERSEGEETLCEAGDCEANEKATPDGVAFDLAGLSWFYVLPAFCRHHTRYSRAHAEVHSTGREQRQQREAARENMPEL